MLQKLCIALCVLLLTAIPLLAMEQVPAGSSSASRPVLKKDGPKTPDEPATPTVSGESSSSTPVHAPSLQDVHTPIRRTTGNNNTATTNQNSQRSNAALSSGTGIKPTTKSSTMGSQQQTGRK